MTTKVGIVLFPRVEELDFAGPWEVLKFAETATDADLSVCSVAEGDEPVVCNKGLRVLPDQTFVQCPALDVLLVPGGTGTRSQCGNPAMLDFLRRQAEGATWVTSVCTGIMVLSAAGLTADRRVTTHWSAVTELREQDPSLEVLEGPRYVRDGKLVTSAGVSAGIDMSLWLLGQIFDPDLARAVQKGIEYFPAPPYTAEV